jgi:glucosamine-6-phosphate deaminase
MENAERPLGGTRAGKLKVEAYRDRRAMGRAAAALVAGRMRDRIAERGSVRMVFASAPSQVEFLAALADAPGLDWSRVTAFHMDEYIGLAPDAPRSFGLFIRTQLWERVGVGRSHCIDGLGVVADECARYAALVRDAPIDVVCMGIGENGHIAFNDPPVADFEDPATVKAVELDERCRRQQVNDGCFASIDDVPRRAITLTVPTLMSGAVLSVVVPARSKAEAVMATVHGPISTRCPASILRQHADATLFLDPDSAHLLELAAADA